MPGTLEALFQRQHLISYGEGQIRRYRMQQKLKGKMKKDRK
jgi:hypothetical protein